MGGTAKKSSRYISIRLKRVLNPNAFFDLSLNILHLKAHSCAFAYHIHVQKRCYSLTLIPKRRVDYQYCDPVTNSLIRSYEVLTAKPIGTITSIT